MKIYANTFFRLVILELIIYFYFILPYNLRKIIVQRLRATPRSATPILPFHEPDGACSSTSVWR